MTQDQVQDRPSWQELLVSTSTYYGLLFAPRRPSLSPTTHSQIISIITILSILAMEAIQKEHDRLLKKTNLSKPIASVDKIINFLTDAREVIAAHPSSTAFTLAMLRNRVNSALSQLNEDQKEIYNALGKYGKVLDKKFKASSQLSSSEYDALEGQEHLINRAIAMHLIREGNFDVASVFLKEAKEKGEPLDVSEALTKEFKDLYEILDAMKVQRDLKPAIRWARSKETQLDARGSNLEFELCRLQYIWYFMGGEIGKAGNPKALEYARSEFGRFQKKYLPGIYSFFLL